MNLVNQMLHSGVYDHMSVSEFARAVKAAKRLEEFDVDKWAEETMAIHLKSGTSGKSTNSGHDQRGCVLHCLN